MRWLPLFITLFILSQNVKAQDLQGGVGKLDLHIMPQVLFDANPRFRLGMEYHGFNKWGYSLEFGFGNTALNKARLRESVWGEDYTFFEIRPELKRYLTESSNFETYLAAEFFYSNMTDKLLSQDYYQKGNLQTIFFDEARFRRQKFGLLIKGGTKLIFFDRLILEYTSGIGIAYRDILYSDIVNATVIEDYKIQEWWSPPYKNEGEKFLAQLMVGIKFGYIISK